MKSIWYFLIPVGLLFLAAIMLFGGFSRDKSKTPPRYKQVVVEEAARPPFLEMEDTRWTDSLLSNMTLEEKIGQLFMVAAYSNRDKKHVDEISNLISEHHIGGLIFMQGGPLRQAELTNTYQTQSKIPLMISIDGEWGLAMRLDSTVRFPRQMTLGALQDDSLIYQMGKEIALHCRRLGIHVNFAPVVDVNNNPLNPVISTRSFGEERELVARKGIMYMKGMQDHGVLANAKHFPGHGDTDSDSHYTLPVISHGAARMDSIELYPFRRLIKSGLGSMMVAHLSIPALDSVPNTASTLSVLVVDSLLQKGLGFEGLIFTDALNMKGVAAYVEPGELELRAFLAGNDVLLFPEGVAVAVEKIRTAVQAGTIEESEINRRVRKILLTKQWLGLDQLKPVDKQNLYQDLNGTQADLLNRRITERALTLLNNRDSILPLMELDTLQIASVLLGGDSKSEFQETLENYTGVDHFQIGGKASESQVRATVDKLNKYNTVIVQIASSNGRPAQQFGLPGYASGFIKSLTGTDKRIIVSITANPYILSYLPEVHLADAIIMGYEDNDYSQSYSAQLIFGGIGAQGRLPVSASIQFPFGSGIDTKPIRFRYSIPEDVGMNGSVLDQIDTIVEEGIKSRAFPGAQVLVVKKGSVIFQKSYGTHMYDASTRVKNTDLYDVASITKIAASLPMLMLLTHEAKIDIDRTLGHYLPEVRGTNKENLVIREILAHQSGLRDWIPFYLATINEGNFRPGIYNVSETAAYSIQVARDLFINHNWRDSIFTRILNSPLNPRGTYKYSDLGYYLFQKVIEKMYDKPLDEIVSERFYQPLGMHTTTFKPLEKFPSERVIPTEHDKLFRRQLIHGFVHDQGAAMLGGVAGHAGLFSNANDLAKLMQMYLNGGYYGGERFLSPEIISDFTRQQYCEADNRRGAGFDRKDPATGGPVCMAASAESFGHSGFTGTLAWADPEKEIVYIFLSNRVYPDAENNKLLKMNIRTRVQEVIYQAEQPVLSFNPIH